MIMLLNPGTKKRKRKYSSRLKRRYGKRRRYGYSYKRRGGWTCRVSRKCRRRKKRHYVSAKLRRASASGFAGHIKSFVYPTSYNRRRRRKARNGRRRGRNAPSWIPAYGYNPSLAVRPISGRSLFKSVSAPFDTRLLMSTIPFLSGFMLNGYTSGFIGSFLPSMLSTGYGSYLTGLLGAGVTASTVAFVSPSSFAGSLLGSVSQVAVRFFRDVVMPNFPGFTMMLTGMSDYLTVGDARRARPLNGMADYLTVGDARRARPLNGLDDDELDGLGTYEGVPTGDMVDSDVLAYEG